MAFWYIMSVYMICNTYRVYVSGVPEENKAYTQANFSEIVKWNELVSSEKCWFWFVTF